MELEFLCKERVAWEPQSCLHDHYQAIHPPLSIRSRAGPAAAAAAAAATATVA